MKKFAFIAAIICLAAAMLCGCSAQTDYYGYVSEKRTNIYLYSNDGLEIKIYVSERETPYCADGIKGEMNSFNEIFVKLPENRDDVDISLCGIEGEMNYRAVENCYYLSFSGGNISGDSVEVTLSLGGESDVYTAVSMLYEGVISCDEALKCVMEYAPDQFAMLTRDRIFCGEIYVRLLYDEGCFYYVGVCDREKKITAYLVDGERGKIIATKELNG